MGLADMFGITKFKPCNDEKIHNVIKDACQESNGCYIGGYYAFFQDVLVVALLPSTRNVPTPDIDTQVKEYLRNNLPTSYRSNYEFWDRGRFSDECPEKIKKQTGYVSMNTPSLNKF